MKLSIVAGPRAGVYAELNEKNANWKKIYPDYSRFLADAVQWESVAEGNYAQYLAAGSEASPGGCTPRPILPGPPKASNPITGPQKADAFWLEAPARPIGNVWFARTRRLDLWLNEGDWLSVGQQRLEVLHCPEPPRQATSSSSVSPTSWRWSVMCCFRLHRPHRLPQGNHADLIASITHKLLPLGDEITFIPGHGPISNFGRERLSNPF